MDAHLYLEVTLPMLEPATDFTYKWCVNMGLEQEEAAKMTLAVDEVLTDILLHAYKLETGYVEFWFEYTISEIEITIQEKGEPFDPGRHPYSSEKAINENDFEGAALETIRQMPDHFHFLNRGKDGKEFRLVKKIASSHIKDLADISRDSDKESDEPKIDRAEDYVLTHVTSDDAEDIAKLIYRSYSYTYPKEDLYFPGRIEVAIRNGYKFGTIIRTEQGAPAGYFAVVKSTNSKIGEVGEAVVSPSHRKRGLMKKMLNELIAMSRQKGLLGLFGMANATHFFSQKVNAKFGFKSTAMILATSPKRVYKGMEIKSAEIVSVIFDFLPLIRRWRRPVMIPETYKDLLEQIYGQFEKQPSPSAGQNHSSSTAGNTDLKLNILYEKNSAVIIVKAVGSTFEASCLRMFRSIEELNLTSVYIDLPLNQFPLDSAIKWLKDQQFILAGLMPLFHQETDYLRMQRVHLDVDFEAIKTHSNIASKLKERIKSEYDALQKG